MTGRGQVWMQGYCVFLLHVQPKPRNVAHISLSLFWTTPLAISEIVREILFLCGGFLVILPEVSQPSTVLLSLVQMYCLYMYFVSQNNGPRPPFLAKVHCSNKGRLVIEALSCLVSPLTGRGGGRPLSYSQMGIGYGSGWRRHSQHSLPQDI